MTTEDSHQPADRPGSPEIEAIVEQPRGSFIKRGADGRIEMLSPLPCPYNYGSIPGTKAEDGAPIDVIVLGPKLPKGTRVRLPLVAWVEFIDEGMRDYKLVLSSTALGRSEEQGLIRFFQVYTVVKRLVARLSGRRAPIDFRGIRCDTAALKEALPEVFRHDGGDG